MMSMLLLFACTELPFTGTSPQEPIDTASSTPTGAIDTGATASSGNTGSTDTGSNTSYLPCEAPLEGDWVYDAPSHVSNTAGVTSPSWYGLDTCDLLDFVKESTTEPVQVVFDGVGGMARTYHRESSIKLTVPDLCLSSSGLTTCADLEAHLIAVDFDTPTAVVCVAGAGTCECTTEHLTHILSAFTYSHTGTIVEVEPEWWIDPYGGYVGDPGWGTSKFEACPEVDTLTLFGPSLQLVGDASHTFLRQP